MNENLMEQPVLVTDVIGRPEFFSVEIDGPVPAGYDRHGGIDRRADLARRQSLHFGRQH